MVMRYTLFSRPIFISLISFLLCLLPSTSGANVQALLNQNTAYIDEPVTLTIKTNSNTDQQPDLSPLKKDFRIMSTRNHSQMSFINGKTSSKKSWIIQLQPLRKGKIIIPAITFGNEQTQALTLTISDAPAEVTAATKEHVFVEATVTLKDDQQPHVQQQISYTVKLFYDDQLLEYEMYPPTIDHAVIEQLQQKDKYRVSRNGKTYTVIERDYVISAEKSGQLKIPPTLVKGSIRYQNKKNQRQQGEKNPFFQNDPFGSNIFSGSIFGERGKAITLRSNAINVDVQPLPTSFKGNNWLPAENVILTDSWQQQLPIFRVGEPVKRILGVEAKGLASSQIPKLVLPQIDTIRAYPEQENSQNYTDGTTVIGKHTQTISYIPNKAGEMKIPAIELDWWNVTMKQQQTARLPAIIINIEAGSGANKTKTNEAQSLEQKNQSNPKSNNTSPLAIEKPIASDKSSFLFIISLMISLLALLFILFKNKEIVLNQYYQLLKKQNKRSSLLNKNLRKHLQQACENDNPQQAAHYLLLLMQQQWPDNPPQNLGLLAKQLAVGSNAVKQLNQHLYANNNNHWKGKELWTLVETGLQQKTRRKIPTNDGLNPLYPTR